MNDALTAFERFKIKVAGRVDAVRARCWLWHSWGRWEVTERFELNASGRRIGDGFLQERSCQRCGLTTAKKWQRTIFQNF